jgi:hypothetical protein
MKHLTTEEIEAGLPEIIDSPKDSGILEMIVCRPQTDQREVLEVGELDTKKGLIGDRWGLKKTNVKSQLTLMNSRTVALLAQAKDRWQLAGDQLYVDLDLTDENLPHGTRLKIGEAVIEITPLPHNGCKKFVERFGMDAMKFVNSPVGKKYHLRGIYAKVVQSGAIREGDSITKI